MNSYDMRQIFIWIYIYGYVNTQKIIENIDLDEFAELVKKHKDKLVVGAHALDHLSMAQRKIYTEDKLTSPVLRERPTGVGLQKNGRYAVFYKRDNGYLKLIIALTDIGSLEIVTFINPADKPYLERL